MSQIPEDGPGNTDGRLEKTRPGKTRESEHPEECPTAEGSDIPDSAIYGKL